MNIAEKKRHVALQKQVAIAKIALLKVREYARNSPSIAETALEEMAALHDASLRPIGNAGMDRFEHARKDGWKG